MKQINIELIKDASGITAVNHDFGTVDYFDDSTESRKEFVQYLVDQFINVEVEGGYKYK